MCVVSCVTFFSRTTNYRTTTSQIRRHQGQRHPWAPAFKLYKATCLHVGKQIEKIYRATQRIKEWKQVLSVTTTIYLTKVICPVSAIHLCSLWSKFNFMFGYFSASVEVKCHKRNLHIANTDMAQTPAVINILLKHTRNFHDSCKVQQEHSMAACSWISPPLIGNDLLLISMNLISNATQQSMNSGLCKLMFWHVHSSRLDWHWVSQQPTFHFRKNPVDLHEVNAQSICCGLRFRLVRNCFIQDSLWEEIICLLTWSFEPS